MKIGTLGAGTVAQAIARHAVAHGHQVVLSNSRGPASLAGLAKDLTAAFGFAPVDLGSLREGGRLMQLGGPLSGLHALKQD
ncbi:NAD(P)-binding domain-containing protein [Streptomyces sp. NPDC056333]|uniref:NAD(P)-binding domain-containing protein n=1 Tax=Streptomyces sp. NPDC056333 TaxID=3345786 RepID=UPI0035E06CBC